MIHVSEIDRRAQRVVRVELLFMTACATIAGLCGLAINMTNPVAVIFGGLALGCAWHLLVLLTFRLAGRWCHAHPDGERG